MNTIAAWHIVTLCRFDCMSSVAIVWAKICWDFLQYLRNHCCVVFSPYMYCFMVRYNWCGVQNVCTQIILPRLLMALLFVLCAIRKGFNRENRLECIPQSIRVRFDHRLRALPKTHHIERWTSLSDCCGIGLSENWKNCGAWSAINDRADCHCVMGRGQKIGGGCGSYLSRSCCIRPPSATRGVLSLSYLSQ